MKNACLRKGKTQPLTGVRFQHALAEGLAARDQGQSDAGKDTSWEPANGAAYYCEQKE